MEKLKKYTCCIIALCLFFNIFLLNPCYAGQADYADKSTPVSQQKTEQAPSETLSAPVKSPTAEEAKVTPAPSPSKETNNKTIKSNPSVKGVVTPKPAKVQAASNKKSVAAVKKNTTPAPTKAPEFEYNKNIPMKAEHQKLLWDYCKKRNLDYIDMLALISTESNFNEKCSTRLYKGYFQISKNHGVNLSKTLKTPNTPLDGAVNINWGTWMFSSIMKDKRLKNLSGRIKRDTALSIYQRGTGGFDRSGISQRYLISFYKKRVKICSYFKK